MAYNAISGGIPTLLLSGDLGSGKTTLLRQFLDQPEGRDTAVIVNEIGEIGIDAHLLASKAEGRPAALLGNGCVCCSLRGSLEETIEEVLKTRFENGLPPARQLVIELSGLSRPGPVIRQLGTLGRLISKFTVVSTCDCIREIADPDDNLMKPESIAAAHTVVFTKTDLAASGSRFILERRVQAVNPMARMIWNDVPAKRAVNAFSPREDMRDVSARLFCEAIGNPHPNICVARVFWRDHVLWQDVQAWLDIVATLGERLLRIKGLVRVIECDEPILVEAVGTSFSTPRRMARIEAWTSGLVLIASSTSLEELTDLGTSISGKVPEITRTGHKDCS